MDCRAEIVACKRGRVPKRCRQCLLKAERDRRRRKRHARPLLNSCEVCGGPCRNRFCGGSCKAKAQNATRPDRRPFVPCERCGVMFKKLTHDQRFCGRVCQRAALAVPVRSCEGCGKDIRKRPRFKPDGRPIDKARFCSRQCSGKTKSALYAALPKVVAAGLADWFCGNSWGVSACQRRATAAELASKRSTERLAAKVCGRCGKPNAVRWSRFCSDECRHPPAMVECRGCGAHTLGRLGRRSNCGECKRETKRRHKGNHRNRCHSKGLPYDPRVTLARVRRRDGCRCRGCGVLTLNVYTFRHSPLFGETEADPRSPTVDHIVPLKHPANTRHGHTMENTQLLCCVCNSLKSDALPAHGIIESDNPRRAMTKPNPAEMAGGIKSLKNLPPSKTSALESRIFSEQTNVNGVFDGTPR